MSIPLTRRQFLTAASAAALPFAAPAYRAAGQTAAWSHVCAGGDSPGPRWDHHLAADAEGQMLLLFGGRDGAGTALSDTWIFDLASESWSRLDIEGPAPRFGAATAVDAPRRRYFLFGGEDGPTFYGDTWRFDFKAMSWRLQDDGASVAPAPRYGLGAVIDTDGGFVISHGFTFEGRFDDTWVFDSRQKTWAEVSPAPQTRPLKRCLHEMALVPEVGLALFYGGCSSGFGPCPQGDLWALDIQSRSWREITPAIGPSPRSNPALVWDADGRRAILFGGSTDAGAVSDLWQGRFEDEAFVWEPLDAGGENPGPRSSHDAVILGGALYVFGGNGPDGPLQELWRLTF
jgi:Rab9 effector protein with kelch motifs